MRLDACARVPAPAREALASFFTVTGRESISEGDFAYFALLDQAHTPAVITKGISAAAARFARHGRAVSELTLEYVWQSLKHYITRKTPVTQGRRDTGAVPEGSAHPSPPSGFTPLRW